METRIYKGNKYEIVGEQSDSFWAFKLKADGTRDKRQKSSITIMKSDMFTLNDMEVIWGCEVCGVAVPNYLPIYCCSPETPNRECDCQGRPIIPCYCSKECGEILLDQRTTTLGMLDKEVR